MERGEALSPPLDARGGPGCCGRAPARARLGRTWIRCTAAVVLIAARGRDLVHALLLPDHLLAYVSGLLKRYKRLFDTKRLFDQRAMRALYASLCGGSSTRQCTR